MPFFELLVAILVEDAAPDQVNKAGVLGEGRKGGFERWKARRLGTLRQRKLKRWWSERSWMNDHKEKNTKLNTYSAALLISSLLRLARLRTGSTCPGPGYEIIRSEEVKKPLRMCFYQANYVLWNLLERRQKCKWRGPKASATWGSLLHQSQQFEHPSSPGDSLIFFFNRLGCLFLAYEQPGSTIFLSVYGVQAASHQ